MQRMEWSSRLDALVVFRGLLNTPLVQALRAALAAGDAQMCGAVAAFEAALFARGTNWTRALLDLLLEDENLCLRVAAGGDAGPVLEKALDSELDFLQALGRAGLDELFHGAPDYLPRWQTDPEADYHAAYRARRAAVGRKGYGIFARYHVFTLEDGHLVPVRYPDPQRLSELPGYEREREKVIANTRPAGRPPRQQRAAVRRRRHRQVQHGQGRCQRVRPRRPAADRSEEKPALPDPRPDGRVGPQPAQVHPFY